MNRLKLWIITALATALALSAIGGVSAQPQPPLVFTGTVDGGEAATGLDVRAYIDGTDCTESTSATLTRSDGKTHYWVRVAKSSQTAGCGTDGDTVRFRIDGKWADQRGTFDGTKAKVTLNLTLSDAPPSVTIQVAVWRRISDQVLAISTLVPGGSWITHRGWPLDMSQVSDSGNWNRSEITALEITLSDGSTTTIEVAVWRRISDQVLAISTKAPGGSWITHRGWPLDMSQVSDSGNWNRSEITPVTVDLQ